MVRVAERRVGRGAATTGAGVTAGLSALLLAAPRPHAAVAQLAGAASSDDPTAPLVAAVALLAWAVSGWLALTVVLVALSQLPGLLGRSGRAVAARVVPATVRRAVEAALGVTVAVGVMAPTAGFAAPVAGPVVSASGTEVSWDLDWPSAGAAGGPVTAPLVTAPPATPRPPTPRPSTANPAVAPAAVAASRPVAPAAPATAAPRSRALAPAPAPASVVVRPGDSLWSLAEHSLRRDGTTPTDRQVAQAWPRWWAANRAVIGDDPDLLLPGTLLRPPPADAS